jgi:hypothetical protein
MGGLADAKRNENGMAAEGLLRQDAQYADK